MDIDETEVWGQPSSQNKKPVVLNMEVLERFIHLIMGLNHEWLPKELQVK